MSWITLLYLQHQINNWININIQKLHVTIQPMCGCAHTCTLLLGEREPRSSFRPVTNTTLHMTVCYCTVRDDLHAIILTVSLAELHMLCIMYRACRSIRHWNRILIAVQHVRVVCLKAGIEEWDVRAIFSFTYGAISTRFRSYYVQTTVLVWNINLYVHINRTRVSFHHNKLSTINTKCDKCQRGLRVDVCCLNNMTEFFNTFRETKWVWTAHEVDGIGE